MKKITSEKYNEMLEILPPITTALNAFLVGESTDHNGEYGTEKFLPRYQCYRKNTETKEFFDMGLMTINEFEDKYNLYDLKRLTSISRFDFEYSDEIDKEIWRGFYSDLGRYWFDTKLKVRHWWFQMDNKQDASYFWERVNLDRLLVVSYIEGDIYVSQYKSRPQLAQRIKSDENFRGIDAWLSKKNIEKLEDFLKAYNIKNY